MVDDWSKTPKICHYNYTIMCGVRLTFISKLIIDEDQGPQVRPACISNFPEFFFVSHLHCLALCHSFVLEDVVRLVERAMVTQQWSRAGRVGWYQQKRSLMISKGFPNSWSYNCAMDFKHAASPKWFKSVDTHWAGKVQSFVPLLQNKQGAVVFT